MADFLAGVGTIMLRDGSGNLVLSSDVLTESGVNITSSAQEVRGSLGNVLLGQYFTDSNMELTLTNASFDPQYIALNVGSDITIGASVPTTETLTVGSGGAITTTKVPQAIGNLGTIGWYKAEGSDSYVSAPITFTGSTATLAGVTEGTAVCVKYWAIDGSAKEMVIPGSIIPKIMHATLTIPKFAMGVTEYTTSAMSGEIIIDIPSFQLNGSVELSLSSNGTATVPLSGKALKSKVNARPCDMFGQFGTLTDITYNKNWYDDLTAMAIASGDDIQLAVAGTETLSVMGIYDGMYTGLINNSNLTFTSSASSIATVSNAGVVAGVATGTATITIVATGKTSISATARVTIA